MSSPSQPAPQPADKGTRYVIFEQTQAPVGMSETREKPGAHWHEAGRVDATSATGAIRKHAETASKNATYLAVPDRSYQPQKVTVETTKTVRLG